MRNRHAQPEKMIFFPKISIGGVFWVQMASNRGVSKSKFKKMQSNIIPYWEFQLLFSNTLVEKL